MVSAHIWSAEHLFAKALINILTASDFSSLLPQAAVTRMAAPGMGCSDREQRGHWWPHRLYKQLQSQKDATRRFFGGEGGLLPKKHTAGSVCCGCCSLDRSKAPAGMLAGTAVPFCCSASKHPVSALADPEGNLWPQPRFTYMFCLQKTKMSTSVKANASKQSTKSYSSAKQVTFLQEIAHPNSVPIQSLIIFWNTFLYFLIRRFVTVFPQRHMQTQKFWGQLLLGVQLLMFSNWFFSPEIQVHLGGKNNSDPLAIWQINAIYVLKHPSNIKELHSMHLAWLQHWRSASAHFWLSLYFYCLPECSKSESVQLRVCRLLNMTNFPQLSLSQCITASFWKYLKSYWLVMIWHYTLHCSKQDSKLPEDFLSSVITGTAWEWLSCIPLTPRLPPACSLQSPLATTLQVLLCPA